MKTQERERAEAVAAADAALEHLERSLDLLDSAGNWGLFDMLAGGWVSSLIKHKRIDDAEDEFNAARDAVLRFAREAEDVDGIDMVRFDVNGLVAGIDIFMDNVLADVYVQSKIEKAKARVRTAIRQIEAIRAQLLRR